jgi:hypothetical protein
MSKLNVNSIEPSGTTLTLGASGDTVTIPSGATIDASAGTATGFGKVLQVVTLQYNTIETHSAGASWQNTGLSAAITPSSASNKVLVLITASVGASAYGMANVVRDSTALNQGTATGSRVACTVGIYGGGSSTEMPTITLLDSPSTTSATTYLLALYGYAGNTTYLNRTYDDTDAVHTACPSSSITLMEIEG